MVFTIGFWWSIVYFILGFGGIIGGTIWFFYQKSEREKPIGGIIVGVCGLVFVYFWIFAGTHFQVDINKRALLLNTVNQTVLGVKDSGIQSIPMLGVGYISWPAETQLKIDVVMNKGVASATTKNGTSILIKNTIYVDLSKMSIDSAYQACNGEWNVFLERILTPSLMSVARNVSQKYSTSDHTFKRDDWQKEYEEQLEIYLADPKQGFNIKIIKGRTVMSWDFSNSEDATAYDTANRAAYQVTQKENEQAALKIEKDMVDLRNEIVNKTSDGTVISLEKMSSYLKSQPPEIRAYLIEYLNTMSDMEYLRLVSQQKPEIILPPHGSAIVSSGNNTAVQPSQKTTEEKK